MIAGTKRNGSEIAFNANVPRAATTTATTTYDAWLCNIFVSPVVTRRIVLDEVEKKTPIKSNAINYNQVNFVSFGGEFSSGNN